MDDRDRGDPRHRVVQGDLHLRGGDPTSLHPEQRGHGLQVVLHPVVDLPDGGVLGDQLAFLAAQVAHIAAQHDRAHPIAAPHQRQHPDHQMGFAGHELGPPGVPARQHRLHRFLHGSRSGGEQLGGQGGQVLIGQVADQAQAPVGAQCIRARVLHLAGWVDADEPVAHPRTEGGVGRVRRDRERARGDHPGQHLRCRHVRVLQ